MNTIPTLLATLALAAAAQAQTVIRTVTGAQANSEMGATIEPLFDFNNDGYMDYVTSSTGAVYGNETGDVMVLSGRFITQGVGVLVLDAAIAATIPANGPVTEFGHALAVIEDVNFDGKPDLAVSGLEQVGPDQCGTVWIFLTTGGNLTPAQFRVRGQPNAWFGFSIASLGDVNSDGRGDMLIGVPYEDGAGTDRGKADIASGRGWVDANAGVNIHTFTGLADNGLCGYSVAAGDFVGNSRRECVIACPRNVNLGGVLDSGIVRVYDSSTFSQLWIAQGANGERFGTALDVVADLNGDGRGELVIGAPYSDVGYTNAGRAVVYSGAALGTGTATQLFQWTGSLASARLGSSLAAGDVNGDGTEDVIAGAPGYVPFFNGNNNGGVFTYSGQTGALLGQYVGSADDNIGNAVSPGFDQNGDGIDEYAAASLNSNANGSNSGVVRFVSLFPETPSIYCAGKLNSQGCTPAISYNGALPSLTSPSAFNIRATNLINNKPGMLLYGYAPDTISFQGGTLCLKSPIRRVGIQNTLGNPAPNDCSGTMTYDFNARIQSGLDAGLTVQGQEVFCQYWARDPAAVAGSSLSNALRFVVNP